MTLGRWSMFSIRRMALHQSIDISVVREGATALSQAMWLGERAVFPLHVCDRGPGTSVTVMGHLGCEIELTLDVEFASLDVVLSEGVNDIRDRQLRSRLSCPSVGQRVEIVYRHRDCIKALTTRVRDMVKVHDYTYKTRSGRMIALETAWCVFLEAQVWPGLSGSPVVNSSGTGIIGFIHGNAAANNGSGVCLTLGPSGRL